MSLISGYQSHILPIATELRHAPPAKHKFEAGAPVTVSFKVLGPDYQPLAMAPLRVTLEVAEGSTQQIDDLTTDKLGTAKFQYENLEAGAYSLNAQALDTNEKLGTGQGVFIIQAESPELAQGTPRPQLLAAISQATEGSLTDLTQSFGSDLKVVDPEVIEVDRRRNLELWDNGWALAMGILLFAFDWAIRRRNGYL